MENTMTEFWSRCEGRVMESYRFGQWLGGAANGAVYETEFGADAQPAVIKLIAAETASQRQLATWQAVSQLCHPRLIRILDCGQGDIDGAQALFVVLERADGNLGNVIPERA